MNGILKSLLPSVLHNAFSFGAATLLPILVSFAKAHERLVSPGVLIENRDFDDPGLDHRFGLLGRAFNLLQFAQQVVGPDGVGVEFNLERSVGRANFRDALNLTSLCRGQNGFLLSWTRVFQGMQTANS